MGNVLDVFKSGNNDEKKLSTSSAGKGQDQASSTHEDSVEGTPGLLGQNNGTQGLSELDDGSVSDNGSWISVSSNEGRPSLATRKPKIKNRKKLVKQIQVQAQGIDVEVENESNSDTIGSEPSGTNLEIASSTKLAEMNTNIKELLQLIQRVEPEDDEEEDDEVPELESYHPDREMAQKSHMFWYIGLWYALIGSEQLAADFWIRAFLIYPRILNEFIDLEYWAHMVSDELTTLTPICVIGIFQKYILVKQGSENGTIALHIIGFLRFKYQLLKQEIHYVPTMVDVCFDGFVTDIWIKSSKACRPTQLVPNAVTFGAYTKVANQRHLENDQLWEDFGQNPQVMAKKPTPRNIKMKLGTLSRFSSKLQEYRVRKSKAVPQKSQSNKFCHPIYRRRVLMKLSHYKGNTFDEQGQQKFLKSFRKHSNNKCPVMAYGEFVKLYKEMHSEVPEKLPHSMLASIPRDQVVFELHTNYDAYKNIWKHIQILRLIFQSSTETHEFVNRIPEEHLIDLNAQFIYIFRSLCRYTDPAYEDNFAFQDFPKPFWALKQLRESGIKKQKKKKSKAARNF